MADAPKLTVAQLRQIVTDSDELAKGAKIVDHLLQNAPEANAQTKAIAIEHAWGDLTSGALARLIEQHAAKRQSAEAAEGLASFKEKRPAAWYRRAP